jgi:hypothetical protein
MVQDTYLGCIVGNGVWNTDDGGAEHASEENCEFHLDDLRVRVL